MVTIFFFFLIQFQKLVQLASALTSFHCILGSDILGARAYFFWSVPGFGDVWIALMRVVGSLGGETMITFAERSFLGCFGCVAGLWVCPFVYGCCLQSLCKGYIGNLLGFTENLNLRLKVAIAGGHCGAASHCTFRHCFTCGYSFFLTCAIFPIFFALDCSLYSYFRFCLSHIQANLCLIQEYTHTYSES